MVFYALFSKNILREIYKNLVYSVYKAKNAFIYNQSRFFGRDSLRVLTKGEIGGIIYPKNK